MLSKKELAWLEKELNECHAAMMQFNHLADGLVKMMDISWGYPPKFDRAKTGLNAVNGAISRVKDIRARLEKK